MKLCECGATRFAFNLNEHIRFKPTEYGCVIYKAYWMAFSSTRTTLELKVDDEGYAEIQLWTFMQIFGPHFRNGIGNQPCETEVFLSDILKEQLMAIEQAQEQAKGD